MILKPNFHSFGCDGVSEKSAEDLNREILLDVQDHLIPEPDVHYINHLFDIPPNASKVGVILSFEKKVDQVQLYISLHDPNGFRGHQQCPGPPGDFHLDLWVSSNDAVEGALPGLLPAGKWRAQIDFDRLFIEVDYQLIVYAEFNFVPDPVFFTYPENHLVKQEPGWYRGELHAHSSESDGRYPVYTVVEAAIDSGLDFLSLTEHFTISQWRKFVPFLEQPIALIRSCEITANLGHANLQGIKEWVDVYVDRPDWSMTQAAEAVHAQGGLFCVNHAFNGYMAWRYFDFDWRQADLIEIYHNLEGCNNDLQLPLWDHLLNSGLRIVGVAGSDSHDPFEGHHKFGRSVTWVYADELSEKGIISGLRRGKVYVSRGPQLRFSASRDTGETAEMWESLPLGDSPVTFCVDVLSDEPLRLFFVKNGFLLNHHIIIKGKPDEWQSIRFTDKPNQPSFYRVELHKNTGRTGNKHYPGIYWRDYSTMRALSNPIWVGKNIPPRECLGNQ